MYKPLRNQVIVKPIEQTEEKKSTGGIFIPGTVEEGKYKWGKVVATGPGYLFDSGIIKTVDVKVDDEVFYGSGFIEITFENEKYLVMSDENCLLIK